VPNLLKYQICKIFLSSYPSSCKILHGILEVVSGMLMCRNHVDEYVKLLAYVPTYIFRLQVCDYKYDLWRGKWRPWTCAWVVSVWIGLNSVRVFVHYIFYQLFLIRSCGYGNIRLQPSQEPTFVTTVQMYSPAGWTLYFWVHLQNCCKQWLLASSCLFSVWICPSNCME
jgi:hypothetical protein